MKWKKLFSKYLIAPLWGAIFIISACGNSGGLNPKQQEPTVPVGELRVIEAPDGSLKIPVTIVLHSEEEALPRLQPAVDHWASEQVWQESEPDCVPLPWQSDPKAGPYLSYIDASEIEGTVLYVSGERYAEGGAVVPADDFGIGTRDRPFRKLQDALDQASTYDHSVAVIVSNDVYAEDLVIPPGVFLLGSFSAFDWTRHSVAHTTTISNQAESMIFEPSNEQKPLTFVDGFAIYGKISEGDSKETIQLMPEARVVLSHNKLISNRSLNQTGTKYVGAVLSAEEASLQAYHNIFIKHPGLDTASSGVFAKRSCTTLVKNHFIGFINASYTHRNVGKHLGNVIETDGNGIRSSGENLYLEGNTIGFQKPKIAAGYRYALYIESAEAEGELPSVGNHPILIGNTTITPGYGCNGFSEAHDDSDPQVLSNNHFVVLNEHYPHYPYWMYIFYLDRDSPHPPELNSKRIHHIDEVNAMADIPENGTNTLEIVDAEDYY